MSGKELAVAMVARLRSAGYVSYLTGGSVRDLLLGRTAKDFDVATSARPDELLRLFPGSGEVGAHFGVVLVREGRLQVEVATFRSDLAMWMDGIPKKCVSKSIRNRMPCAAISRSTR